MATDGINRIFDCTGLGNSELKKEMSTEKKEFKYDGSPLKDEELLLQGFYDKVSKYGDEVYLTQPGMPSGVVDYTFNEVYDQAARLAAYIKQNAAEGSNIAIISKNCAHFFACELAIWMAGCTTVALFPNQSAGATKYILEHSKPKLLFFGKLDDSAWTELKSGIPSELPSITFPLSPEVEGAKKWEDIQKDTEPICESVEKAPTRGAEDDAIIVYTSGSTGKPKGVLHTFFSLSKPTKGLVGHLSVTRNDRYLSYLPIAHVMDRLCAEFMSFATGMHIYFAESLATFKDDLQRCRPTLFVSVPRLWLKFQAGVHSKFSPSTLNTLFSIPLINMIIKKKILKVLGLDCVRFAGSGSAPIPADVLGWYRTLGLDLLEGYGMSENFCYSHTTYPGKTKAGFIGQPFPGSECKLSEEGEILVKSPGMMKGYYLEPEKTAEVVTEDGFLRTGDKGFIDDEGCLKIIGRVKEIFKTSKGKYVAPAPIENIVNNNPNVELSLCGGSGHVKPMVIVQLAEHLRPVEDPDTKEKITSELKDLLKEVNEAVEEHEKIGFILVAKDTWTIEKELLTPTMKLKRASIEALYADKLESLYEKKETVLWEE